nr:immunoglobulin heavy chain junction region [Mus musculus]
CALGHYW